MMGAPLLPTPQSALPAGLLSLLTAGKPLRSGAETGFDRLIAAAPTTALPSVASSAMPTQTAAEDAAVLPMPITPTPVNEIATIPADTATPAVATTPVPKASASSIATSPSAEEMEAEASKAPATVIEPEETQAATRTAQLLIAVNVTSKGSVAATAPAAHQAAAMADDSDLSSESAPDAEPASTPQASNWVLPLVAPAPTSNKSAAPLLAAANGSPRPGATTPPNPTQGRKTAQPTPTPTLVVPASLPVEPTAARPSDAPSMTILFAQPMMEVAAPMAETAAPSRIAERLLDLDSDGAWIDQLARDIAATRSDTGDISFRLMPRHLGRLDVALRQGSEGLALRMDTQHEATATIVTGAQARLVDDLRQQGVRVAATEVTCTPGESGRSLPSHSQGQWQGQSQGQSHGHGRAAPDHSAHLIETAADRADAREHGDRQKRPAERGGRFA